LERHPLRAFLGNGSGKWEREWGMGNGSGNGNGEQRYSGKPDGVAGTPKNKRLYKQPKNIKNE